MTYEINLNMEHGGVLPRVNLSQYDNESPTLAITLYDRGQAYTIPSGTTVHIAGTKKDGTGFEYVCTYSGSVVTAEITEQMTVFAGDVVAELILQKGEQRKGTQNFILCVERAALSEDTQISETDIPIIEELPELLGEAIEAATTATEAASSATSSKNAAAGSASAAAGSASNAASSASAAAGSASTASTQATNAGNSATAASQSASSASGSASAASNSATSAGNSATQAEYWAGQAAHQANYLSVVNGKLCITYEK